MNKTKDILQILGRMRAPASSKLDERVYREIENAVTSGTTTPPGPELTLGQMFALFIKKPSARYTLATTAGLAILAALVLIHPAPSAWAMDQAIETLKKYKGLELSGTISTDGKTYPIDLWLKADGSGDFIEAALANVGGQGMFWTMDNKSYTYDPDGKTVYTEPGITLNLNPWPGPKMLSLLLAEKNYKVIEGYDPATGQKRVVVTCSSASTGNSLLLEFDVSTKLLVSMKIWDNPRQDGTPHLDFQKILYFDDLADSMFNFQPPSGTFVTNMPLTVPDASLPALSDTNYGISVEGMTREQACQTIVQQYWNATVNYDFAGFRRLSPSVGDLSDEFLRKNFDLDGIVQVLKIGGIERTGRSKLGPLALVPAWVRAKDGTVAEVWMIVQFRESDQGTSCVIYIEHGYALNVKE
ncbi:MAG TPA: hypothetical protein VNV43_14115 [Candidatus Acidoferrales bacterium]|nr:hypothetical protein [Candidatus Acidoferrales bacterium]